MKVLFVCTGNICRSPMAEAMFRDAIRRRGCGGIETASAGTWASASHPATSEAERVLASRGIDLSRHRSQPLAAAAAVEADLIVAMTSVHVDEISRFAPEAASKVRLLKELPELSVDVGADAAPPERLAALLRADRPAPRRALDVDDPIGLPLSAYERCGNDLEAGIEALVRVLCGRREQ